MITRFAPSPTGLLHLGGLRTALFNFLLAKRSKGEFILRIDDTDRERNLPGAEDNIRDTLRWCRLIDDNTRIIRQSERLSLYRQIAETLISSGHAYKDYRTEEELSRTAEHMQALGFRDPFVRKLNQEPRGSHVIRFKDPCTQTTCHDTILKKIIVPANTVQNPQDRILVRADGWPTYHLASVVDDHELQVTNVIRGQEWLSSLALHVNINTALGWEPPTYTHLGPLMNKDGTKLSKRTGSLAVEHYRESGYEPEAVLNLVAQLGWNNTDVMDLEEMTARFSLDQVSHSRPIVDLHKLGALNKAHLERLGPERLKAALDQKGLFFDVAYCQRVLDLAGGRFTTISELLQQEYYFQSPRLSTGTASKMLIALQDANENFNVNLNIEWTLESIKESMKSQRAWKALRYALTGRPIGPKVIDIMLLIGKQETQKRLMAAQKHADMVSSTPGTEATSTPTSTSWSTSEAAP